MENTINELSRVFDLLLPATFKGAQRIIATEQECVGIAKRLDILKLKKLMVEFTLAPSNLLDVFKLEGRLHAELTQKCVVTMLPVDEVIDESMHITIKLGQEEELPDEYFNPEMEDVEYVQDTKVDIGELIVQYLSLSMNPYPRQDGVYNLQGDDQDIRKKPFAKLEELKK